MNYRYCIKTKMFIYRYSTNSKVRIVQDIYVLKSIVMVRWNGINKKDENVQKIEFVDVIENIMMINEKLIRAESLEPSKI